MASRGLAARVMVSPPGVCCVWPSPGLRPTGSLARALGRYTRCGTHGRAPNGASRAATVSMRDGGRATAVGKSLARSPGALGAPSESGVCSARAATRRRRGVLKRKREARLRAGDEKSGGICANTQRAKTASSAAVAAASAADVHAVSSSGTDLSHAKAISPINGQDQPQLYHPRVI